MYVKSIARFMAVCTLGGALSLSAQAATEEDLPLINVSGSAKVMAVPDVVDFSISIESRADTVAAAYKSAEKQTENVLDMLDDLDVEKENIQAMQVAFHPVIDHKRDRQVVAHIVRRDINVRLEELKQYAKAIDKLSALKDIRIHGAQLSSSNADELQLKALAAAFANAKAKAETLADAAGGDLGDVFALSESGGVHHPRPMMRGDMAMAQAEAAIEPGTIAIHANVQVSFEFDD